MKEALEYIAKKILPHPEAVEVFEETEEGEGRIELTLVTHPEDVGLAIGKNGKTVRALRELLKIKAVQQNVHVYLDVLSNKEYHRDTTDNNT